MRHALYFKVFTVLAFCVLGATLAHAQSARVFFSSPPRQISEGERVTIEVKIGATNQPINAVSGILTYPENLLNVVALPREGSIINLWTKEPKASRGRIPFEGVAFNPGFRGEGGLVFKVTFEGKQAGVAYLNFSEGAVLANDGQGTNVLATLGTTNFRIIPGRLPETAVAEYVSPSTGELRLAALPVIIEYSSLVSTDEGLYVKGQGEPGALTKIVFKDVSSKSIGERFIEFLQTRKKRLDEVLVNNNEKGEFEYTSPRNLLAGVYNATPFLVDESTNTEKPGFGVQLLVDDSKIVKALVVLINVLGLLIPVVALVMIIYFIPWYSWHRMRVIKKELGLKEEELVVSARTLERKDEKESNSIDHTGNSV